MIPLSANTTTPPNVDPGRSRPYITGTMITTFENRIVPADFPELRLLAWNRDVTRPISPEDAFALYERNWRFVDKAHLTAEEEQLIQDLKNAFGGGHMLFS